MDGSGPASPGRLLESAVDQTLSHQRIEVEADCVGMDPDPFGEFSDAEWVVGGSQCFEYGGAARLLGVVGVSSGHDGNFP
jgi:hypothetical protein